MKILSNEQIRLADAYTIANEPISSLDLMERAANQLYREWINHFTNNIPVEIFAGPGNNGGDGIALARLLANKGYNVKLYIFNPGDSLSPDADANFRRLPDCQGLDVGILDEKSNLPLTHKDAIIVDSLFGSGLSRPLDGPAAALVKHINSLPNKVVAVDIPSGLFAEDNGDTEKRTIIKADFTWCFQFPKLAFMMPENEKYTGEWKFLDIGLHKDFIDNADSSICYLTGDIISALLKPRNRFSHKGDFGHALLLAGSKGKFGAAILAARACLRSGAGLLTVHMPSLGASALHSALPEAMINSDPDESFISTSPDFSIYSAVGIGPGIGTGKKVAKAFSEILSCGKPMILDADALNILAENQEWLSGLPEGSILTPHPGEFKRLFGEDKDHYSRLHRMREIAYKNKIIIVLKGANTAIADTDGNLWFNSTGNPGMATGGSGDVLSGIILSLLAQAYTPLDAALIGVYVHGLAGDEAVKEFGEESLIAGDIIDKLHTAFKKSKQ